MHHTDAGDQAPTPGIAVETGILHPHPHPSRRLARFKVIFREGDESSSLLIVRQGLVKLVTTAQEESAAIDVLGPGDVLGEEVLYGTRRAGTATTLTDVVVCELSRWQLEKELLVPEFSSALLAHLGRRLASARERDATTLGAPTSTRVARCLVDLAHHVGVPHAKGVIVHHGLTQLELARVIGSSRESVNKALRELSADGWLVVGSRWLMITDTTVLDATLRATPDLLARPIAARNQDSTS